MIAELAPERRETENEFRIVFLIGNGSRLKGILDRILDDPGISVTYVASHRKPKDGAKDIIGIAEAKNRKPSIPTGYWIRPQMNAADKRTNSAHDDNEYKATYMRILGDFISQENYRPNLVVMTGWDLILDQNIIDKIHAAGARIINVHPHPLPGTDAKFIETPDGTEAEVKRGTEAWVQAIDSGLTWSGATVHEVLDDKFDTGPVLAIEWIPIEPGETADSLRGKLNTIEDKLVPQAIKKIKEESKSA